MHIVDHQGCGRGEGQAEAIGLGAEEVLHTTGPPEKIAAAVERLICTGSITAFSRPYSPECVEGKFLQRRAKKVASYARRAISSQLCGCQRLKAEGFLLGKVH